MSINPDFTGTSRYPFLHAGSTAQITPFTLRDGVSYLEKLERLAHFVDITLRGEFKEIIERAIREFNASMDRTGEAWTTEFRAYMKDVNASLMALNDKAMATLIDTAASETGGAIRDLIEDMAPLREEFEESNVAINLQFANHEKDSGLKFADHEKQFSKLNNDVNAVRTSVPAIADERIKLSRAEMSNILLAADLGADPTGVRPADDAMDEAFKILTANGGGSIMLDGQKFLFNRVWNPPMNGEACVPIEIYGRGMQDSSTLGQTHYRGDSNDTRTRAGGTIVVHNAQGAYGKIYLEGRGRFKMHNFTLTQSLGRGDITPFIFVRRATAIIESIGIDGFNNTFGKECWQTGIMFGSANVSFNGYGSTVRDVIFNRLKLCMRFGNDANSIQCDNIIVTELCGASDETPAILFDGTNSQCRGNSISNLIFELCYYVYGVRFKNSGRNTLYSPQFWDMHVSPNFFKCIDLTDGSDDNAFYGVQADNIGRDNMFYNPSNMSFVYQFAGVIQARSVRASWLDTYPDKNGDAGITSSGSDLKLWADINKTVVVQRGGFKLGECTAANRHVYAANEYLGTIIFNREIGKIQVWTGTKWETVSTT